jgi:hypothetical protein
MQSGGGAHSDMSAIGLSQVELKNRNGMLEETENRAF